MKVCLGCLQPKPATLQFFSPNKKGRSGLHPRCRMCENARSKAKRQALRERVLGHYSKGSPSCACCGELEIKFLALDHVGGGGVRQRRELSGAPTGGGDHVYLWIVRNNYPPGFRVLCHNCNMAIGFYGICPHQRVTLKVAS